jgi:hypothetical protein
MKKTFKLRCSEVVLVSDENRKRQLWPLGQTTELLPDKDGTVRLARVKTSTGEYLQTLQRLYPIEVRDEPLPEIHLTLFPSTLAVPTIVEKERPFWTNNRKAAYSIQLNFFFFFFDHSLYFIILFPPVSS